MNLVTGGTGFIGSALVERMISLGMPVRCLVRNPRNLRHLTGVNVELVEGDLSSGAGLDGALDGVGAVFHLAGVTKALHAQEYYAGNRDATAHLVEACSRLPGVRLLCVSSLAAAGPSRDGRPVDEATEPRPVSHYGRSKLQAEEAVSRSVMRARTVILRPPVVYGPRDTDVLEVFRLAARGIALQIGRGESYFSLIHVDDLVSGLLAAAKSEGGSTYFLANSEPCSWSGFAELAAKALKRRVRHAAIPHWFAEALGAGSELASRFRGKPAILSRDKVREARFRYWVCDSTRAKRDLGFTPALSAEQGVAQTIRWCIESGWLK